MGASQSVVAGAFHSSKTGRANADVSTSVRTSNRQSSNGVLSLVFGSIQAHGRTPPRHFRFLDLPAELRNIVYEELLIVGKIFYSPDEHDLQNGKRCVDYGRFRKPDLSLLQVSKQVHAEAEAVYLSKNLFVLPVEWYKYKPFVYPYLRYHAFSGGEPKKRHLFSQAGLSLVRNISLAIDKEQGHCLSDDNRQWKIYQDKGYGYGYDQLDQQQRLDFIHNRHLHQLRVQWGDQIETLGAFRNGLDYIELDFTNAFCLVGCCRPIDYVLRPWIFRVAPSTFEVIGLKMGEESQFVVFDHELTDELYTRNALKKLFGLRFRRLDESTKWDLFKVE